MANSNPANQWQKGQSGNPNGRPAGLSLTTILKEALEEDHKSYVTYTATVKGKKVKKKKLVKTPYAVLVVKRLIDTAVTKGDIKALREIFDRVDGKAVQPISGPNGGPLEHVVIDPETQKMIEGMQSRFLKVKKEADAKRATKAQPSGNQATPKKVPVKKVVKLKRKK